MGGPHALRCKAFRAGLNLRRKEVFFAEVFKASHQRTLSAFWGSSARQSSREHLPFLSLRPANHASPRWTPQRTCQGLAVNLNTCLSLLPFLALNFTCYVKIGESPRVYRIHTPGNHRAEFCIILLGFSCGCPEINAKRTDLGALPTSAKMPSCSPASCR